MVHQNTDAWAVMSSSDLHALMQPTQGPCISIYMPTSAYPNEADQNRIRFKNQLRAAAGSLGLGDRQHAAGYPLLAPLYEFADDIAFWSNQKAGLAVFRSPTMLHIRRLLAPMPERTVVADSFHVKPLIRIVQLAQRYELLCLTNRRIALYQGVADQVLTQVPLHPDVPRDMAEALGEPSRVTKTRRSIYDQGETDPRDAQLMRYFRRVDQAIWDHHSRLSNLPLILAALPEYHGHFHHVSHNPHLLEQGIRRDPFVELDEMGLAKLAWKAAEPQREQQLAALREQFSSARAHQQASDELPELARLAAMGKLHTLMIQQDHHQPGSIDPGTGAITPRPMDEPEVDDLIDDLAELTFQRKGTVLVLTPEQMPTGTGVAGIARY